MGSSTTRSYWRSAPSTASTPAVLPNCLQFTFDGAAANTTSTGKVLPAGAIVLAVDVVSGHTGGITPAVDIGSAANPDGFVDGAVSTTTQRIAIGTLGADAGSALSADTTITAGDDGTGTAGTGNITAYVYYVMSDDGALAT